MKAKHLAIGSINSPMQCMMKEICAQCLQPHVDPVTGEKSYVFSCFNQDQELDQVDFPGLRAPSSQNSLQEKLTALCRWTGAWSTSRCVSTVAADRAADRARLRNVVAASRAPIAWHNLASAEGDLDPP